MCEQRKRKETRRCRPHPQPSFLSDVMISPGFPQFRPESVRRRDRWRSEQRQPLGRTGAVPNFGGRTDCCRSMAKVNEACAWRTAAGQGCCFGGVALLVPGSGACAFGPSFGSDFQGNRHGDQSTDGCGHQASVVPRGVRGPGSERGGVVNLPFSWEDSGGAAIARHRGDEQPPKCPEKRYRFRLFCPGFGLVWMSKAGRDFVVWICRKPLWLLDWAILDSNQ